MQVRYYCNSEAIVVLAWLYSAIDSKELFLLRSAGSYAVY